MTRTPSREAHQIHSCEEQAVIGLPPRIAVPDRKSYIFILHPDDERLFTLDGQRLPLLTTSSFGININQWNCCVQEAFHLPFKVVFLRNECGVPVPEGETHSFIYMFEIPQTEVTNIGQRGIWIEKEKVPELFDDLSVDLVTQYLREFAIQGLNINSNRLLPFSKRGWFDRTSVWSRNVLSAAGFRTKELQQHETGTCGLMLLTWSELGVKFYVKGCHPTGIYNEAAVTLALGRVMSDDFTAPVGVDLERNVLVMKDLGSEICLMNKHESDTHVQKLMFSAWGEVQLRSISKKEELVKSGLPVWDMEKFQSLLEEMFDDADWWSLQRELMTEEETLKYDWATCKKMFLARAECFYREIAQYNVPFSLVHGDLNEGNVLVREDSSLSFIDLSYTVWGFPFFDLAWSKFEEAEEVEFYLEFWSTYESIDRLKELFELTVGFRKFWVCLKEYHMFKYAEQREVDYFRQIIAPIREWFEEEEDEED